MRKLHFLFLLTFLPFSAQAEEPLKVKYGLYAGGFNVATLDAVYTLQILNIMLMRIWIQQEF